MFRDCNGESNGLEVICQNMKLENIFSKSNLVDESLKLSFQLPDETKAAELEASSNGY